jgi:hypothetical protein
VRRARTIPQGPPDALKAAGGNEIRDGHTSRRIVVVDWQRNAPAAAAMHAIMTVVRRNALWLDPQGAASC